MIISSLHHVTAIVTDPPGCSHDEWIDDLGANLKLPPWMEPARLKIEKILPKITLPTPATL